jgi:hypothetical protein
MIMSRPCVGAEPTRLPHWTTRAARAMASESAPAREKGTAVRRPYAPINSIRWLGRGHRKRRVAQSAGTDRCRAVQRFAPTPMRSSQASSLTSTNRDTDSSEDWPAD